METLHLKTPNSLLRVVRDQSYPAQQVLPGNAAFNRFFEKWAGVSSGQFHRELTNGAGTHAG